IRRELPPTPFLRQRDARLRLERHAERGDRALAAEERVLDAHLAETFGEARKASPQRMRSLVALVDDEHELPLRVEHGTRPRAALVPDHVFDRRQRDARRAKLGELAVGPRIVDARRARGEIPPDHRVPRLGDRRGRRRRAHVPGFRERRRIGRRAADLVDEPLENEARDALVTAFCEASQSIDQRLALRNGGGIELALPVAQAVRAADEPRGRALCALDEHANRRASVGGIPLAFEPPADVVDELFAALVAVIRVLRSAFRDSLERRLPRSPAYARLRG